MGYLFSELRRNNSVYCIASAVTSLSFKNSNTVTNLFDRHHLLARLLCRSICRPTVKFKVKGERSRSQRDVTTTKIR